MISLSLPVPLNPLRGAWLRSALLGFSTWMVALIFLSSDWAADLLLFGALVIVPLGLATVDLTGPRRALSLFPWLQLGAALMLAVSFGLTPGLSAALLAVPWLAFTMLMALLGLLNLRRARSFGEFAVSMALIFIAIGGSWAFLARAGLRPLDFDERIVLLTGDHFHYAGFALPILTGLAALRLRDLASKLAVAGVIVAVPLVAVGITVTQMTQSHDIELAASWLMSAVCLLVAVLQFRLARRAESLAERLLFGLSGISLFGGLGLAALYALGAHLGRTWLTIPEMIPLHGTLNALGFSLLGLLAWVLRRLRESAEAQILFTGLGQKPDLKVWETRPFWSGVLSGPQEGDQHAVYEREVAYENPGDPEQNGPHRRLAAVILRYEVFPTTWVSGVLHREPVEIGDTVGIRYHFVPGIDLFFAARVTERFDECVGTVWRTGFTYATVAGHPEYGVETFSVEKDTTTGKVIVALRSWSRPGTFLALLCPPWVRRQQVRASYGALANLASRAVEPPAALESVSARS
jgi:hypothetical protein